MAWVLEEDTQPAQTSGNWVLEPEEVPPPGEQIARGAALGALDIPVLPLVPFRAVQKGGEYFGKALTGRTEEAERTPSGMLPGQQNVSDIQFDILQKMRRGETPTFEELMFLSDEDVLPAGTAESVFAPITKTQEEISKGGDIEEIARRATRSAPFALGGPASYLWSAASDIAGLGGKKVAEAAGFGETGQTVADILTSLGFGLIPAFAKVASKAVQEVPKTATQKGGIGARAEIQASRKTLDKNLEKLEKNAIETWNQQTQNISKKTFSENPKFQSQEIADELLKENNQAFLNKIHPTETTSKEAWTFVREAAEETFKKEESAYKPLYQASMKQAENMALKAEPTLNAAKKALKRLNSIATEAPGTEATRKVLNNIITDLSGDATASKGIRLKQILNDVINYETLTLALRDKVLKPVVETLRQNIQTSLSERPLVKNIFNDAERKFASTAKRFGRDAIKELRSTETPETLINQFNKPSNLETLKSIVSGDAYNLAERKIVENILDKSLDSAKSELRNFGKVLSQGARESAEMILESNNKLASAGQKQLLQNRILEDVQKAVTTGSRPETTLKAMQTPQGYRIVKETLSKSENGKQVLKTIEKQFMNDVFDSIFDQNNRIDWNKAKNVLKDPQVAQVVKDIGGKEAVDFLQNIEKYGSNITHNLEKFTKQNKSWTGIISEITNHPVKVLMHSIGFTAGGPLGTAATAGLIASSQILEKSFLKMITSPTLRGVIRVLGSRELTSPKTLYQSLIKLNYLLK